MADTTIRRLAALASIPVLAAALAGCFGGSDDAHPLAQPAARQHDVDNATRPADLSGSFVPARTDGRTTDWAASSNQPWLKLHSTSGSAGTPLAWNIDVAAVAAMADGSEQRATITLTAPEAAPVMVDVALRRQLAAVNAVGPELAISGRETTIHVLGRGFDRLADPARLLQVAGGRVAQVERIDDTSMSARITAGAEGAQAVRIANGLGLATTAGTLQVLAPQTYAYAAMPTGTWLHTPIFDARRRALVAIGSGETVRRWRLVDGGGWVADQVAVPGVRALGLGPQGTSLVTLSVPQELRLIDAGTLAVQKTVQLPERLLGDDGRGAQGRIALTVGGGSWFGTASGLWTFHHQSHAFSVTVPPVALQSHLSYPVVFGSEDGDRLLIEESAGAPPLLHARVSRHLQLQRAPAGTSPSTVSAMSADGSRIVSWVGELRDSDFATIGTATVPGAWGRAVPPALALSPDGRRVYVLAYHHDAVRQADSPLKPRVYVFDASAPPAGAGALPLLGHFELHHYPGCRLLSATCGNETSMTISPDGNTLFFLGAAHLVVTPVPPVLSTTP